ncbi:MAG: bifunctional folylpolyglutamate synthase/dihydrofolate synthase [Oscillospiraceae bacterium]|nr:bifunctional folylpolyglutamate synthase/dihydrofolate synthase [Oscillospiraceae bacterium]
MTYEQAIDYIHSTLKFGSVLGLDNIRELMGRLGNPQKQLKIIHVGGTNGKGSTCAFITQILMSAGFSVGMFISPYLHEFNERIQINRENISAADLAACTARVKSAIDEMMAEGNEDTQHPTEFEIVTAIGLLHFFEQNCDYVVLEVGMGGNLDATNVIDAPYVSVATSMSFDHMEHLGYTIEEITSTVCGIIKPGGILVCYPMQNPTSARIFEEDCMEKDAIFILPDEPEIRDMDIYGTTFDYDRYKNLKIRLLGEHQVYNATTAIAAIEALRNHWSVDVTPDAVYAGLEQTAFAGRFEVINDNPLTIIDGAHNVDSVNMFANGVEEYLADYNRIIVMGMLSDKEYEECIKKVAQVADIFIATTPDNPRALTADAIAAIAGEHCENVVIAPDKWEAIELANDYAADSDDDNSAICVCGSLYLISGLE